MLQLLSWKDRVLLVAVLIWQILYCIANFILWAYVDLSVNSDPSMTLLTTVSIVVSVVMAGLSSMVLISLSLYQFRKTGRRFFGLLLGAGLLELILPGFAILQAFFYGISPEEATVLSYVQIYFMNFVYFSSMGISAYAFAAYGRQKGMGREYPGKLGKTDYIVLSLTTGLTVAYLLIPKLYPQFPDRFTLWSIVNILSHLSPLVLLWPALWQYRRTGNPFFRYFCLAFSLAVIALLLNHSMWYLMGGTSYEPSLETARIVARWHIGIAGLAAVINLGVLGLKAYALATYKDERAASHDISPA